MHRWVVGCLILLGTAAPAGAQLVRQLPDSSAPAGTVVIAGVVQDAAHRPLLGAEARIGQRRVALSDSTGRFVLRGVPAGPAELVVRRIGYVPATVRIAPSGARVRLDLVVELADSPVRLDAVVVEGKAYDRGLWNAGFYKRQAVGYGKYYDPDYMAHYGGADVATLARESPRVQVEKYGPHYYAYGRIAGEACRLNVFVDGNFRREAMSGGSAMDKGVGLDELVPKEDVYAVEVYPTVNSLPVEFVRIGPRAGGSVRAVPRIPSRGMGPRPKRPGEEDTNNDAACGAIVIWTKWWAMGQASDSLRRP